MSGGRQSQPPAQAKACGYVERKIPARMTFAAACVFWRGVYARRMSNTTLSFIKEDPWRIFRIMAEFVDSFEVMSQVGPGVTIFGSARTKPNDPYYQATMTLA